LVIGLLLVPNAAIWAAGYVTGPGFAVGAGTGVSPFGAVLGPVPALPLLAALPAGAPPQAMRLVLIAPLLAGVLAGLTVARRVPAGDPSDLSDPAGRPADRPEGRSGWPGGGAAGRGRARRCAGYGAAAGVLAGGVMAVLAVLSGGSVGAGYLTAIGPSPWQFGLAVAVEVGVPAALVAALLPPRTSGPARA
ncbi:MAG TPA: DUF6350 family protein, partial [Mycobacteriales bacterium]|nr:DUF6350 family protein [Mycobacteriales bacterium]